ncbi:MAG: hypothetical protein ACO1N5_00180 [Noviherbaspirillum sp.]
MMMAPASKSQERNLNLRVRVPDHLDPAIETALRQAAEKVVSLLAREDSQEAILARADRVAQAFVDHVEPDTYLTDERIERLRAIRKMFHEGEWLTAAEIRGGQATPPAQKSQPAADWKRRGRIFSVAFDGKEYFPLYQFDANLRPLPIIADILRQLGPVADSWTIAAWFHFPNAYLAEDSDNGPVGVAPKDVLDKRDEVLHAAVSRTGTYVA